MAQRQTRLLTEHIDLFRQSYQRANILHSFTTIAIRVLPDHLHEIWQMPIDDGDFALSRCMSKSNFSRNFAANAQRSNSKIKHRDKDIWQRRYWEHQIIDNIDLQHHVDYLHYNPVKHGHVSHIKNWPYSTFHKYVKQGIYTENWGGFDEDGTFGE